MGTGSSDSSSPPTGVDGAPVTRLPSVWKRILQDTGVWLRGEELCQSTHLSPETNVKPNV